MMNAAGPLPTVDETNCDKEPIHIPGSIQPQGFLIGYDEPTGAFQYVSQNVCDFFNVSLPEFFAYSLDRIVGVEATSRVLNEVRQLPVMSQPVSLGHFNLELSTGTERFEVIAHRTDTICVLEFERASQATAAQPTAGDTYRTLNEFSLAAESLTQIPELCQQTAEAVRTLVQFDRVMVYQFDAEWNGTVVGESRNERLPEMLHHRFPASDIPAQARNLYRMNRFRIIPDGTYSPVPLMAKNSATSEPLNMTFCTLRSVSPVHLEYMRNMETAASMSISILRNGELWGLIACHNFEKRFVTYSVRTTCDLLARAFSLRLSALEHTDHYERRVQVRTAYSKLLAVMADRGDFAAALAEHPEELLSLVDAQGAAIITGNDCCLLGVTPDERDVRELSDWLFQSMTQDAFITESLSTQFPKALGYADKASGLLALSISKIHSSYLMWFRPEVVQTIKWAGNVRKEVEHVGSEIRLHPRRSFETWKETVRHISTRWVESEVDGAMELRSAIVGIVLRKAEELVELNAELKRSNQELEAFSYSVSHDLRAPLRHIVGYAEMLKESRAESLSEREQRCVDVIIESSEYAGQLVDKLLGYSRLGRSELQLTTVDMNLLIQETQRVVMRDANERNIEWRIGPLPNVQADLMMLRMAFRDLLSNAVKYTRDKPLAIIEIDSRDEGTLFLFRIKDNGVGFDMKYVDKLFGVFQRLHRWEDYEGTGIGLANVRRVIHRHGGNTWAEGQEGHGATFYLTLPKRPKE